jgi:chitodextrinase
MRSLPFFLFALASFAHLGAVDTAAPTSPADILFAKLTDSSIELSWSAGNDGNGSGIAGYNVYRNGVLVGSPANVTYVDAGLIPATTYIYTVKARDSAGNVSSASSPYSVSTIMDETLPSTPAAPTSPGKTETTVSLSWPACTDNVGIAQYEVLRAGANVGLTEGTTFTDSSLIPGTAYSYTIRARDAAGNRSSASSAVSVTTNADAVAPTVPTTLVIDSKTENSVTLSWELSTDNVAMSGYQIYRGATLVATVEAPPYTNSGLSGGTTYSFTVKAKDVKGNISAASTAASVTTNADILAPNKPQAPRLSTASYRTILLTWPAASDNVAVTSYTIFREGVSAGTASSTSFTDSGLLPLTSYHYSIQAKDSAGNTSTMSDEAILTTLEDVIAPLAPNNVTISTTTDSSIALTWAVATDPSSSGIASYEVISGGTIVGTPTATSYTVTGLSSSTSYSFTVVAVDYGSNRSGPSFPVAGMTALDSTAPSTPSALTSPSKTATSVSLNWTGSTDAVGVTGYRILRGSATVGFSASTSFTDTGISPNTANSYTIKAYDAAGNVSAASTALSVTTAADTVGPTVPTGLATPTKTAGTVSLTWNASSDAVAMFGYQVLRGATVVATVTTTAYTDVGLVGNTAYSYTIKAKDLANNLSAASTALSVTTLADATAPSTPTVPNATTITATSVVLDWLNGTDNVGVTAYQIYQDGVLLSSPTTSTYTATGLTPGTTYAFTVLAKDAAGNASALSGSRIATTLGDITAPNAPTNITRGALTTTSVALSWTASTDTGGSGILNYDVIKNGTTVSTVTTTSTTVTGLTASTAYTFTVKGRDKGGNVSAASLELPVTTTTTDTIVPSIPTALTNPNKTETTADLTWTASADNVAVAGYEIFRASVKVGTSTTASFTDSGLVPGTAYSYTVRAYDAPYNRSAASTALSVTTIVDTVAPTAPTSLTSPSHTDNSVSLSWTASSDSLGVTSYDIYRGTIKVGSSSTTTYTDIGLIGNTAYSYTIKARDLASNTSAASTSLSVTTNADLVAPATPQAPAVTALTFTSVTLAWLSTSDNVGVVNYRVYRNGALAATVSGTTLAYADNGQTPNTAYSYYINAVDAAGNVSAASATVSATTLNEAVAPTAPNNISVSSKTDSTIALTWNAGADTGGSGIVRNDIYRDGSLIGTSTSSSYTASGLAPSTAYAFSVVANDAAGNSSTASLSFSAMTKVDQTDPSVPTGLTSPSKTEATASISWAASTDNVAVIGYEVLRGGVRVGTANGTSYTDVGLKPGTAYSYTLKSFDAIGNRSNASSAVSVTTINDTTAPTAPANLAVGEVGAGTVALTWNAGSDAVGVAGYDILRNGSTVGNSVGRAYVDTGLTGSTNYVYTVKTRDLAGNLSPASNSVTASTRIDTTAPTAPSLPTFGAITATSIVLNWLAAKDDAGIANYDVKCDDVIVGTTTGLTFTVTALSPNSTHALSLIARDSAGNTSSATANVSATTLVDTTAPTVPKTLLLSARTDSSLQFSWTGSTDTGGSGVASYEIFRDGTAVGTSTTSTFTDSGLTPATAYSYAIVAIDVAGNRSLSSLAYAAKTQVDSTKPSNPEGLTRTDSGPASISMAWQPSTDNVGIIRYNIYRNGAHIASSATTMFTDTSVGSGAPYSYLVRSLDEAGNWSNKSSILYAETTFIDSTKSLLVSADAFDASEFANNATYRDSYLQKVEPGRVWGSSAGGSGIPIIAAVGSRSLTVAGNGQVSLQVVSAELSPVTFVCTGEGNFTTNGDNCITVRADAQGQATVTFTAPASGRVSVLAASPQSSGQVRFSVKVQP